MCVCVCVCVFYGFWESDERCGDLVCITSAIPVCVCVYVCVCPFPSNRLPLGVLWLASSNQYC